MSISPDEHYEVRYVEVPQIEYKDVIVPKIQTVEIEKRVPKIEVIEIEKEVDVCEVHHVTKEVEKLIEQQVVKHVPRHEVVEVPVEVVKQIPRVENVVREQIVNVPGEIIEVPRTVTLENRVPVYVYHDAPQETVVAQTLQPLIRQVPTALDVPAVDYDPVLCKVVIPIPKPVTSALFFNGKQSDHFRYVQVGARQYNGLVHTANRHLPEEKFQDLLVRDAVSGFPIPPVMEVNATVVPPLGPVEGPKPPSPFVLSPNAMAPAGPETIAQQLRRQGFHSHPKGGSTQGAEPRAHHHDKKPTMLEHWHKPQSSWLAQADLKNTYGSSPACDRYYRDHHKYFGTTSRTPRRAPSPPRSRRHTHERAAEDEAVEKGQARAKPEHRSRQSHKQSSRHRHH